MQDQTIRLIEKYGGAVPRYTSFPTAVQFHDGYKHSDAQNDLKDISAHQGISLYVHIPFCHSLCHYCGCHTKIVHSTNIISEYVQTLCEEIRIAAGQITHKPRIKRIHFGGGSPNYAPIEDLQKIIETIYDCFNLKDSPDIDMECDPRLLNQEKLGGLISLGIKRFSFGIQDFDEKVQLAINRLQPYELVKEHVLFLKKRGVHSINFDLITGLPQQTHETISQTLERVLMLEPSRIAVFPYAHVPWMKKHQLLLEKFNLPRAQERFIMGRLIHETLVTHGYNEIGIDHYALPDDALSIAQGNNSMKRNFQGYTDDNSDIVLGFGLSAISQFENSYAQNTIDVPTYRRTIESGRLPTHRGLKLSSTDKILRELIMKIMCDFRVDLSRYPSAIIPLHLLVGLQQEGLIEIDKKFLKITEAGKPFTRVIAATFDPYLKNQGQRHAKAI